MTYTLALTQSTKRQFEDALRRVRVQFPELGDTDAALRRIIKLFYAEAARQSRPRRP